MTFGKMVGNIKQGFAIGAAMLILLVAGIGICDGGRAVG